MLNRAPEFFLSALSIVLIDILLAGDNAVVIAMAVKSLSAAQRRTGTLVGAAGAIVLRIVLTFFAARLLELPFLKLVGGLLILWIAVKLLIDSAPDHGVETSAHSLRQAIWMILVADITMSLDNILAVAAASKGNLPLLLAGLALSISFVVFMSGYLARIMDRYPIVVWAGAAILGRVAGSMVATDPWVREWLIRQQWPLNYLEWGCEIAFAALVLIVGQVLRKNGKKSISPGVS